LLARRGWIIYHPQAHPVREQLEMLDRAAQIAGIEGSAFHTLLLLKQVRAKVQIIPRRGAVNENFETIATTKGFRQEILDVPSEVVMKNGEATRKRRFSDVPGVASLLANAQPWRFSRRWLDW